jgi:heme ABC exporter ATP-binding subunit CcmA
VVYDDDDVPSPVVSFRSVVALAGQFPVLSGVDLDLREGEIVLLEGPNGAGKTSLLRAAAGLLRPSRGEAEVVGVDLFGDPKAVRRQVGFLGHESFLYGDLTATENAYFFVRASDGDVSRIPESLERLGLGGRLASIPVDRLSAGQRRRAAMAAIVARDPLLWLLDEPHAGLDAASRAQFDSIVREAAKRGRAILFSSHEAEVASALATRTVSIRGGAIESVENTFDLTDSPKVPTNVA